MIDFLRRHPFPVRSVYRRVYQNINPIFFPMVHVNEFPKSGGTWLCRMLRDCLEWRLDDNTYPLPGKAVMKHHRLNFTKKPTVTVIRDPRDVMVSYYHHCRKTFDSDGFNRNIVKLMNEKVFSNCTTPHEELQTFVEMQIKQPISPKFTWGEFYSKADRNGAIFVRYEDLRVDPAAELERIFDAIGQKVSRQRIDDVVDEHDIKKILKERENTNGAHFIREGSVGGWRNALDAKAVKLLERDAGELLVRYGYA